MKKAGVIYIISWMYDGTWYSLEKTKSGRDELMRSLLGLQAQSKFVSSIICEIKK